MSSNQDQIAYDSFCIIMKTLTSLPFIILNWSKLLSNLIHKNIYKTKDLDNSVSLIKKSRIKLSFIFEKYFIYI